MYPAVLLMCFISAAVSIVVIWMATSKAEDRTPSPIVSHTTVLMVGGLPSPIAFEETHCLHCRLLWCQVRAGLRHEHAGQAVDLAPLQQTDIFFKLFWSRIWWTFFWGCSQIAVNFQRNSLACRKSELPAPYFQLFKWRLSTPCR